MVPGYTGFRLFGPHHLKKGDSNLIARIRTAPALVWLVVLAVLLIATNRLLAGFVPADVWGAYPAGDLFIIIGALLLVMSQMRDSPIEKSLGIPLMLRRPDHEVPRVVPVWVKVAASSVVIVLLAVVQVPWVSENLDQLEEMTGHAGELWSGAFSSPAAALLLSLRAGINEELLFRLLAGTGVMWAMSHIIRVRVRLIWASAAVSGIIFWLAVHPGNILAAVIGAWLGIIYLEEGLVPAVALHFLIDAAWMVPVALILSS